MKRLSRLPLALACLGLGAAGGFYAHSNLNGQAPVGAVVPREFTSYRDIVKKAVPAVVSIESRAVRADRRGQQDEPGGGPPVQVGFGSGVIVDPHGVILTA